MVELLGRRQLAKRATAVAQQRPHGERIERPPGLEVGQRLVAAAPREPVGRDAGDGRLGAAALVGRQHRHLFTELGEGNREVPDEKPGSRPAVAGVERKRTGDYTDVHANLALTRSTNALSISQCAPCQYTLRQSGQW